MVGQVSQLIEKNYVMEMKKKDAEFMALQAQINPTSSLTRWKS